MIVPNYTVDDLKKLPLRGIVALAARCARRVEPLALPTPEHPDREAVRAAVADAIRLAEDFAAGRECAEGASIVAEIERCQKALVGDLTRDNALAAIVRAAHAAVTAADALGMETAPPEPHLFRAPSHPLAHLAEVTAELATIEALTAAREAGTAVGYADRIVERAIGDYNRLLSLNMGIYPAAGRPIDVSPNGPLGQL